MEGMIGGIVGLVGAGLQASAQAAQVNFEYAQLNWQKQRAREQDRFSQASRGDMYGNVTGYDPILNKWDVKLTPDQLGIRDAQEKEQLLQLTKDAPAARAIREQVQKRSKDAVEPFNRAQLAYQYQQPQSEQAIRSDLSRLMAVNDMMRSKADQTLIMREGARLGAGKNAMDVIGAVDKQLGSDTNNRMLEARKMALQEHGARIQQHESEFGTPMRFWGDLMSQGGNMPEIGKNNLEQSLNAQIGQQAQGMAQSFNQGTQGVSSAMQSLAKAVGQSPSLAGIAGAFGKGGGGQSRRSSTGTDRPFTDIYDPTVDYTGGFGGSSGGYFDDRSASGW